MASGGTQSINSARMREPSSGESIQIERELQCLMGDTITPSATIATPTTSNSNSSSSNNNTNPNTNNDNTNNNTNNNNNRYASVSNETTPLARHVRHRHSHQHQHHGWHHSKSPVYVGHMQPPLQPPSLLSTTTTTTTTAIPIDNNSTTSGQWCGRSWDRLSCWPQTMAGTLASMPCLTELNGVPYDTSQNATRYCDHNATWALKSDYSMCKPMIESLDKDEYFQVLWDVREVSTIYYIGYCISLIALTIALGIFFFFKGLRCIRNTIHTNLMITYLLLNLVWIITATLQAANQQHQHQNQHQNQHQHQKLPPISVISVPPSDQPYTTTTANTSDHQGQHPSQHLSPLEQQLEQQLQLQLHQQKQQQPPLQHYQPLSVASSTIISAPSDKETGAYHLGRHRSNITTTTTTTTTTATINGDLSRQSDKQTSQSQWPPPEPPDPSPFMDDRPSQHPNQSQQQRQQQQNESGLDAPSGPVSPVVVVVGGGGGGGGKGVSEQTPVVPSGDTSAIYKEISCYLTIMLTYLMGTNFFWMFVEGLYLYALVVRTFSIEFVNVNIYLFIGWGIPAIFISAWTPLKIYYAPSDDVLGCPWQIRDFMIDSLFLVPVIVVLVINIFFMGKVMWVLLVKLKISTTAESKQYKRAAKALLVLIPLLGATHLILIVPPPNRLARVVFTYLQAFLLSLQGCIVAVLYCFWNCEVRNSLRHHWERWMIVRRLRRNHHDYPITTSRSNTFRNTSTTSLSNGKIQVIKPAHRASICVTSPGGTSATVIRSDTLLSTHMSMKIKTINSASSRHILLLQQQRRQQQQQQRQTQQQQHPTQEHEYQQSDTAIT